MNSGTCSVHGCNKPIHQVRYQGQLYCIAHYRELFGEDLLREYASWTQGEEPIERLRYLLGRMYEEFGHVDGYSYLSAARIRDRGFRFSKTKDGITFSITRHPGAWSSQGTFSKIVQNWQVDLLSKSFKLVGTEEWQPGYPE